MIKLQVEDWVAPMTAAKSISTVLSGAWKSSHLHQLFQESDRTVQFLSTCPAAPTPFQSSFTFSVQLSATLSRDMS